MPVLIGREREIATALDLFGTAASTPVPRLLIVEGRSGIGKSAFIEALAERLGGQALVVSTAAYRIQGAVPLSAVSRLVGRISHVLGDDAQSYFAGKEAKDDPALALLSSLESITLERPVVLIVDDAQWADAESLNALASLSPTLASRPLLVVLARRDDEAMRDLSVVPDENIVLDPLDASSARQLVLQSFADASPTVVDAIVKHADGFPIDVIALAEAAAETHATGAGDVDLSTRAVIAKRIQGLNSGLRTFLQILSLLPDPIEHSLLTRLYPNHVELDEYIRQSSGRYLVQEKSTLRFRHALVGEAVLETIPVKIPLHRRIIEAISRAVPLRIEDKLLIAEQAFAAGDSTLAQATFLDLAFEANDRNLVRMTISASERHSELGEPPDESFLRFYGNLAKALTYVSLHRRAEAVILHALDEARRRRIDHLGGLAAQLVLAQCFGDRFASAKLSYAKYSSLLTTPEDLATLHAAALWFHVSEQNVEGLQNTLAELRSLDIELPPDVKLRMEIAQVFAESRSGDFRNVRARLPRVMEIARLERSTNSNHADFVSAYVELMNLGPLHDEQMTRLHENDPRNPTFTYFTLNSMLHGGRLDDALLGAEDALRRILEPSDRPRMLGPAAAIYALRGTPGAHWKSIEAEALRIAAGEHSPGQYNVAVWAAASGLLDDRTSSQLLDAAMPYVQSPQEPTLLFWRLPIPLAASRLKRKDVLTSVAEGTAFWNDAQPLAAAERNVASAMAAHFLGRPLHVPVDKIAASCTSLGLELARLLLLATCAKGPEQRDAVQQLGGRGITWFQTETSLGKATGEANLTARERQISELISGGKTNKEIAEQLVLSERTVEGHVANIFNKLGVSSRTQIAAWVYGKTTAVP